MAETSPLAVDFTQTNEVLQILPQPPLRSSQNLQWDGLYVQQHHQPAWETPEYSHIRHMLLIHTSQRAVQAERVLDGHRQTEQLRDGNMVVVPATVQHQANWSEENTFTLLFLEPAHLTQVAHESIDLDRVELIPQFARLDPLIHQIGVSLSAELESPGLSDRLFVDALTTALSIHILRSYASRPQPLHEYTGGLSQRKLQQAIDYINTYLGEDLSLEAIAQTLGMSQYYFARLFKQSMGIAPYQYVIRQRVERAKQLLKQPELSISDIALQCGFASQGHLNLHFKRIVGATPRAFRNQ
jgi:AraC family transcriptional regulator